MRVDYENGYNNISDDAMGSGFQEVIYQRCLAIELAKVNLNFAREIEHIVYYNEIKVGIRSADFVVEGKIIVEIKAVSNLDDVHLVQVKNYLSAYDLQVGLLINFGAKLLQFKKIYNPKYNL